MDGSTCRNNGNGNSWIDAKLVGTQSNRSAIGAKVRVKATVGGKEFWQLREISGGGGYGSQNDLRAHFGLGDVTNVEVIRIEWPSGIVQEFRELATKQLKTVVEPPRMLARMANGMPQFTVRGGRGFQYQIDASTNLLVWQPIGALTITNLNGKAEVTETNSPPSDRRFYRAVAH